MLVYRINFANPAADRYSRVALWQVRTTKAELDTAFRSLAIGEFSEMRVRTAGQHRDHRQHGTRDALAGAEKVTNRICSAAWTPPSARRAWRVSSRRCS